MMKMNNRRRLFCPTKIIFVLFLRLKSQNSKKKNVVFMNDEKLNEKQKDKRQEFSLAKIFMTPIKIIKICRLNFPLCVSHSQFLHVFVVIFSPQKNRKKKKIYVLLFGFSLLEARREFVHRMLKSTFLHCCDDGGLYIYFFGEFYGFMIEMSFESSTIWKYSALKYCFVSLWDFIIARPCCCYVLLGINF
jgi:hypothetical protein